MDIDSLSDNQKKDYPFYFRGHNQVMLAQILDHLKCAVRLIKWALNECDKILPEYLFDSDIQEFKNEKLLKYLREAQQIQSDFKFTRLGIKN
jgi:hypothetical protein